MSAAETLYWHQSRFEKLWIEHRAVPLELTDTEILDWIGEHCELVSYVRPTLEYTGGFVLDVDGINPTKGDTLRDAVKLAAGKLKEVNE